MAKKISVKKYLGGIFSEYGKIVELNSRTWRF